MMRGRLAWMGVGKLAFRAYVVYRFSCVIPFPHAKRFRRADVVGAYAC